MSHPPSLDSLLAEGHELIAQLTATLRHAQHETRHTKSQLKQWRAQSKPTPHTNDTSSMMMSSLLGGLFGLPLFDSLSPAIAQGLQAAVLMDGANDSRSDRSRSRYQIDQTLEDHYSDLFHAFLSEQTIHQKTMKHQKKMVLMALLAMLMQEEDTEHAPELVAGDVLRRPSYARFKQNRHSMDCIREAFQRQADSVTTPQFNRPRYRMAG